MKTLATAQAVIDALGGPDEVSYLTFVANKAVYHWAKINRFPARTYVALQGALKEQNSRAPDKLWNMVTARKHS